MNPLELFIWALGVALSIVVLGGATAVAIVLINSARQSIKKSEK